MNCPVCNTTLTVYERQGVEIDACPKCRGVWLDRGELDKLIERAESYESQDRRDRDRDHDDDEHYRRYQGPRDSDRSRRRSWWSELFD